MSFSAWRGRRIAAVAAGLMVLTAPAVAANLTGTAFELVRKEMGRAEAPARLIGRQRSVPAGQALLVNLGVERFVHGHPGKGSSAQAKVASHGAGTDGLDVRATPARVVPLRGTRWQLLRLGHQTLPLSVPGEPTDGDSTDGSTDRSADGSIGSSEQPAERPLELLLASDQLRFSGNGGLDYPVRSAAATQ
ncbi:MAG: hypothetical protein HQ527_03505, partial [Cyanobacteria bacterium]|nr:hypothetical protein [Cyanobacteria bacterium bin.51]